MIKFSGDIIFSVLAEECIWCNHYAIMWLHPHCSCVECRI